MMTEMIKLAGKIGIYVLWSLFDLANLRMIFHDISEKREDVRHRTGWVIFYLATAVTFCLFKNFDTVILGKMLVDNIQQEIFYLLFYLRIIPVLMTEYHFRASDTLSILVYKETEALVAMTIITLTYRGCVNIWFKDFLLLLIAVVFYLAIVLMRQLRKRGEIHLYFVKIPAVEAILLIAIAMVIMSIESGIFMGYGYGIFNLSWVETSLVPVVVLVVLVICFIIVSFITRNRYFSMDKVINILHSEVDGFSDYYSELDVKEKKIRSLRHDTVDHLNAIRTLIEDGRTDAAMEYIDRMSGETFKSTLRVNTGNYIADSIIATKASKAESDGTDIDFSGHIPSEGIENSDLVILLSNILDNAIEACEKIQGKKKISVISETKGSLWILTVKNPVLENVNVTDLETTKPDKFIHGFGIENMRNVTGRYGGTVSFYSEDGMFAAIASVRLTDKQSVLPDRRK